MTLSRGSLLIPAGEQATIRIDPTMPEFGVRRTDDGSQCVRCGELFEPPPAVTLRVRLLEPLGEPDAAFARIVVDDSEVIVHECQRDDQRR